MLTPPGIHAAIGFGGELFERLQALTQHRDILHQSTAVSMRLFKLIRAE